MGGDVRGWVLGLTEADVGGLTEGEVLDLDEALPLREIVRERVRELADGPFRRWLAGSAADLRAVTGDDLDDLDGPERALVDRVVALAAESAAGRPVGAAAAELLGEWLAHAFTGLDPDDPDVDVVPKVDMDPSLYNAMMATLLVLEDPGRREEAAGRLASAAENYSHWEIAGENIRLLLRLLARAAPG